jgi:hypothetical protein
MSLTDFKPEFDNSYQEVFQKSLVAKEIMNTRFESKLKFGESVERVAFDFSGVIVRDVVRGSDSTIDTISDSSELLTINLEKETAFRISDGEVTQAGPMNPGEKIGGEIALKVALDLDARCFAEVVNATYAFDAGDLTTLANTGVAITLNSTTVPQLTTRMSAKLKRFANQDVMTNMVFVVDAYAAADIEQYLLGKDIDIMGAVFKNGYAGAIRNAVLYISENLTGETVVTGTGTFSNGETIVINGITFTAVTAIGVTAGNFLIGANLAASLTNLAGLINAPTVTNSTQVALSTANAGIVDLWTAVATATTVTTTMPGSGRPIVAETAANATVAGSFWAYYGKKGAIDLVVQDMSPVDMRPESRQRATVVFSSYLAGIKTFADGALKFLKVKIAA